MSRAAIALLILLGLWMRWPSPAAEWVHEDDKTLASAGLHLGPRALTRLTWVPQQSPYVARLVNLALHGLNTLLLLVFLRRLGLPSFVVLAVVALWWVHPLASEAIEYPSGRGDLIVCAGVLLACIGATRPHWLLLFAGCAVAVTGKESGVVALPIASLFLKDRRALWGPGALAVAVAIGFYISYAQEHGSEGVNWWSAAADFYGAMQAPLGQSYHISPIVWARLQATATVRLMALSIWPPLGQSPDYDYDRVAPLVQWGCLLAIPCLAALAWVFRSAGLAWAVLASLPRLLVPTPLSYYNEHQFYAALPGMVLMWVGLIDSLDSLVHGGRTWIAVERTYLEPSRSLHSDSWAWPRSRA